MTYKPTTFIEHPDGSYMYIDSRPTPEEWKQMEKESEERERDIVKRYSEKLGRPVTIDEAEKIIGEEAEARLAAKNNPPKQ